MTETLLAVGGAAALFVIYGLMQRGRERASCDGCTCHGGACERLDAAHHSGGHATALKAAAAPPAASSGRPPSRGFGRGPRVATSRLPSGERPAIESIAMEPNDVTP